MVDRETRTRTGRGQRLRRPEIPNRRGEFLLYQAELAGANEATAAGFRVEDFDAAVAQLRANGVVFEDVDFGAFGATVDGVIASPDGKNKSAWFKDSEGNTISLSTSG